MCRILLAFLRGSQKVACRKTRRLIDKSKTFHVTCGVTVCIFSVLHVAAHLVNALNFSENYNEDFLAINAANYRGEDPRKLLFATVPGLTGVIMVLVLFLMCTASTYAIRVSNYDIFWYTHNLFFVFYILLMLHVSGGVLKYQTNLEEHPPGCFNPNKTLLGNMTVPKSFEELFPDYTTEPFPEDLTFPQPLVQSNFMRICSKEPKFQSHFPETWFWISGPLCLYCVERLYRYIRSNKPVTITSVISHPSNVLEVRMIKDDFRARPGQYVILHCPRVSGLESHPFTLTMCPTDTKATFGVHLKVVGDWTERFRDLLLLHSNQDAEILPIFQQRHYPKLYVDGPFGSPFEESLNYEVSLCVAGGIGVTPFASVLNALLDGWKCYKLRRLYFIWVCRDVESFRWFADLLCMLHNKLWQENRPDYINIQLYLSQTDGIQKIIGEKYQALNSRLLIGRPRWKLLFDEIAKYNRRKTIGVFCCGPSKMSKILHKLSNSSNPYGTRFEYNKESFS
ncbi:NADPH oxidase 4 isoform X1 [Gallus gallus]|nr:NADPH oxidase 4 isoform X1 [Gallus gallus]XP_040556354.1 NADPH oxidase 4 isoform X1 [Gallus gallus]XP_040556360.1 NADPH oxidase 4 isoform X1 [Gallus gallus]XP_046764316.1 NADPH oxidase 4 isoform X1 [Gallus gallus]XP_046764317.1 NADPH oxidase 4 isoform X1 [Gallus gallus]XP_046764318.1 NADPH oxidase 4 isoform X1 [Gallus gallus]XP_046764319.1 NADPH oxidase 4 isoform X1 [Gallus gallus]XP_046798080.1 NADPH oxidase 4 isoform X1 [Gallus gallus]